MTRTQRELVNRMVEALMDVAPERRPAALDALCAGITAAEDVAAVRGEVERLLAEDESMPARLALISPTSGPQTNGVRTTVGHGRNLALERVPPIVGRYHIRAPLGKGGMGQVFLAEQRAPIRRTVAVKLIRSGFDSHDVIARFEAERQALARMDHPNIARVLDAGMSDSGRPYFAMEFVDGKPITIFADEHRLTIRQRLELFAQVCDAVAHAHTKGVIHRDLKPSNVLAFMNEDGKPTAKVIDFGIAKAVVGDRASRLADTSYHTDAGVIVGTYEYMSPEQAGMSPDIDTSADVYSLGVLLYELLTGVRPFERKDESHDADEELRRLIRDVEPPRPSSRVRGLSRATSSTRTKGAAASTTVTQTIASSRHIDPAALVRTLQRELEWIPLKALRKERHRRYAGPAELAADVRNYLSGRPLIAAPESKLYLARKFVVRHRAAIAGAAALLLLLVAGIVGTTLGLVREQSARKLADESGRKALWSAYRSAVVAAEVALQNGDAIRLRQAIDAAPSELRGWEWESIAHSAWTNSARLERSESDHFVASYGLADNRRALSATDTLDGASVLWDLQTGKVLRRELGGRIAVDPAGAFFAIVRPEGALELCEIDSGKVRWRLPAPSAGPWRICENSVSPDSAHVLAWDGGPEALTIVDSKSGTSRSLRTGVSIDRISGFIPVGDDKGSERIFFGSRSTLGNLAIELGKGVTERDTHFTISIGRAALQNGNNWDWIPVDARPGEAPIFDIPRGSMSPWRSAYLPTRGLLAYGRDDGSVEIATPRPGTGAQDRRIRRSNDPQLARRLIVGAAPVNSLSFTPDESRLIATLRSGDVMVTPVDPPVSVEIAMPGVVAMQASPDGQRLLGLGWGDVQCVDLLTGMPLWGVNLGPYMNTHAAWSPDGSRIVVTTDAGVAGKEPCDVFILDGRTGAQLAAWSNSAVTPDPSRPAAAPSWAIDVAGIAFDREGKSLFVAHSGGWIERVDASTFESIRDDLPGTAVFDGHKAIRLENPQTGALIASPDGARLAQIGIIREREIVRSGPILIRDAGSGALLRTVAIDGFAATALTWSQDSSSLCAGFSNEGESLIVRIDADSGRETLRISTHSPSPITALTLSRGGGRIIAYTLARRMMVFEAEAGVEIVSSFVPQTAIHAFFTEDGALVTTGNAILLRRRESSSETPTLPGITAGWPDGITRPATLEDARRRIVAAHSLILSYHETGLVLDEFFDAVGPLTDDERKLFFALLKRRPPSINLLNSGALSRMLSAVPESEDLLRAEEMLRQAVQIKPHSMSLQGNYGNALFQQRKYAKCIDPLLKSEELSAARGLRPSPVNLLRLAVAAAETGDTRADGFFRSAQDEIVKQSASNDPEIIPLLQRAKVLLDHDRS